MSFRARLRLFFALIVIVPMIVLGIVLFALTSRTETSKADAGIAVGIRAASGAYREEVARARPRLRALARDPRLKRAIAAGRMDAAALRMRQLLRGELVSIELWEAGGRRMASAGSDPAVAPAGSRLTVPGRASLVVTASVVDARELAQRAAAITGLDVAVARGGEPLAATVSGTTAVRFPADTKSHDFDIGGEDYRGRTVSVDAPAGPPVQLRVFSPTASLSQRVLDSRVLIAGLLLLFVLLALVSAAFVSRALTGQIATFLDAARRLSRGDFRHPVPVKGGDEFAQLGREFNSMSFQLESKIEEVERKRQELEETIRRVGDALATGLDRDGVVALAVRQAVDACEADAGRALPLDRGAFEGRDVGSVTPELASVIEAAERDVFVVRADVGPELLGALEGDETAERTRRAVSAQGSGVHALSIGLRSLVDGPEYLGAISIARRGRPFSRQEEELLEYLAGQAVVSIENAGLHEAIERQAVTDELTGIANIRAFGSILDREVERSRRFDTPLGLVMLDIDDFKRVNDTYGHQQGDEVLSLVAGVLRDLSRDLDAPARYGGEEFAVVLPQTDSGGAALLAERMREGIEQLSIPRVGGGGPLSVTASFGVAAVPESAADPSELIAAADAALYRAKRAGKNRVEQAVMPLAETSSRPR